MHTHLSLSCSHSHARSFGAHSPKGQRKDFFQGNFFEDFFLGEVPREQVTSYGHGRSPCRRRAPRSPRARGAAAASRSRRFCSVTVALGVGPGRVSSPSQTSGPRRPLLSDAPAPFAASPRLPRYCAARHPPDALPAPRQVLGNFHGGPGPLARPGLLRLPRQDPCFPPLPEKKRTRFHQLIQRRAAAFRGARDFADKRPGIGGNQGLPSLPHPRNCLLRPVQMRDARLESAPLSPALVPRRQRQTIQ